jgi:hypothetical protein
MCVCSPFIDTNIDRAHQRGIVTLGCCGDSHHTSGFHVPAALLPKTDYSLVRSGKPADADQACAGDFGMNTPWARRWLAWFVDQAKAGKMPGVVEIIGSLDGKTVLYWAKWHSWVPRTYTGQGHKTWAHISVDRAFGNTPVDFFAGFAVDAVFIPASLPATYVPPFSGRVIRLRSPRMRGTDVLQWQKRMSYRGWRIACDGVFGPQSESVLTKFQKEKKLKIDGILGPQSWAAAWTATITK